MLWPTTPVVQRPTADPKMQQIVEMLWEKLKQDPAFEALEAHERASEEVYPPEVEMDFCGYLPNNQMMDRATDMNLPEDLGMQEEKPLYMTLPTNVQKGGAVLLQYPQQKDLNKLLRRMSQTALHDVHLPIGAHELIAEYSRSPFFKGIYRYLMTQQTGLSGQADREFCGGTGREYVMISGLMFHVVWPTKEHHFPEVRLCIPEKYVPYVLHKYHEELVAGHQGVKRTYHTIWQHFWFPRMYNTIITYIKSCHRCQEAKEPAKLPTASFARIPVNFHPFDRMSMDVKCMVKSRSGFTKILVMNCLITQYTEVTPIKETNAKQVIDLLLTKVFYRWGKPSLIVMDQDPSFTGHLVRMLVQCYQVQVQFMGVHNHGANPMEWYIQSMNNIFCKFSMKQGGTGQYFSNPWCMP